MRFRDNQSGQTLLELLVSLAILSVLLGSGGVTAGVLIDRIDNERKLAEVQYIYTTITQLRNEAKMTGKANSVVLLSASRIQFLRYNRHTGKFENEFYNVEHFDLGGTFMNDDKTLRLNASGTVNKGGTIVFYEKGKPKTSSFKTITVQVANGRIYMDE